MSELKTFEAKLKRLNEIVVKLESGTLSLEQSLALYEEGNELTKALNEELQKAKLKIEKTDI
ncbi:MAG TPA: exodeoxyribonuclease VII small subunit [Bacilli bacterium]|nr:exodeoxyribonuclease VII small subunit [Bacilli bacterium]